ncbi:MAG: aminodeoxychorismate synthase component I [Planctomycetaceae bacterium]
MGEFPVVQELLPPPTIEAALRACACWPNPILFDSALPRGTLGRYSFLSADPRLFVCRPRVGYGENPFDELQAALLRCAPDVAANLPPFQGGVAGLLGYELGGAWERIPVAPTDELEFPQVAAGLYDWVLAWDHLENRCWIISQGWSETESSRREGVARKRVAQVVELLRQPPGRPHGGGQSRVVELGANPFSLTSMPGLSSNFSREGYLAGVRRAIEYIRAGDIFQVNLSQRLAMRCERDPIETYLRLRRVNPAPFAGFLAHDDWAVVSSSPERFLAIRDGIVETRPIKGTRQRRGISEADLFTRDELRESGKDQAENVMIVDLLRNDLSRVCQPGTVRVPDLARVETYETVQHLVSVVEGRLAAGQTPWGLLAAAFPGGSITGAPKVRAMEIIAELEPTVRGPYCGSLFYITPQGTMDSNILIRTMCLRHGWAAFPVGGGIVAQSEPVNEYVETLHKAAGMLRVFAS